MVTIHENDKMSKEIFRKEVSETGFEPLLYIFSVLAFTSLIYILLFIFLRDSKIFESAGIVFSGINIIMFMFTMLGHFAFRKVVWVKTK